MQTRGLSKTITSLPTAQGKLDPRTFSSSSTVFPGNEEETGGKNRILRTRGTLPSKGQAYVFHRCQQAQIARSVV